MAATYGRAPGWLAGKLPEAEKDLWEVHGSPEKKMAFNIGNHRASVE